METYFLQNLFFCVVLFAAVFAGGAPARALGRGADSQDIVRFNQLTQVSLWRSDPFRPTLEFSPYSGPSSDATDRMTPLQYVQHLADKGHVSRSYDLGGSISQLSDEKAAEVYEYIKLHPVGFLPEVWLGGSQAVGVPYAFEHVDIVRYWIEHGNLQSDAVLGSTLRYDPKYKNQPELLALFEKFHQSRLEALNPNLTALSFFEALARGESVFPMATLNQEILEMSAADQVHLLDLISQNATQQAVAEHWLKLPVSAEHPEILKKMIENSGYATDFQLELIRSGFTQNHWGPKAQVNRDLLKSFILQPMEEGIVPVVLLNEVLATPLWRGCKDCLIQFLSHNSEFEFYDYAIVAPLVTLFSDPYWNRENSGLIARLIQKGYRLVNDKILSLWIAKPDLATRIGIEALVRTKVGLVASESGQVAYMQKVDELLRKEPWKSDPVLSQVSPNGVVYFSGLEKGFLSGASLGLEQEANIPSNVEGITKSNPRGAPSTSPEPSPMTAAQLAPVFQALAGIWKGGSKPPDGDGFQTARVETPISDPVTELLSQPIEAPEIVPPSLPQAIQILKNRGRGHFAVVYTKMPSGLDGLGIVDTSQNGKIVAYIAKRTDNFWIEDLKTTTTFHFSDGMVVVYGGNWQRINWRQEEPWDCKSQL